VTPLQRLAHLWGEGLLRLSQFLEARFWKRPPR